MLGGSDHSAAPTGAVAAAADSCGAGVSTFTKQRLVLLQWEVLPLGLDLLVGLQHGAGLRLLYADLEAAVHDLADDDGVDALFLEVGTHGDQQQIDGVVAVEGLQHICPAGGEQAAVVLFQGSGDAGGPPRRRLPDRHFRP